MALPVSANWSAIAFNGSVFCGLARNTDTAATSPDGFTWTPATLPANADWRGVAWNGSVFCAVAFNSTVAATSPDGITWTARTMPSAAAWSDVGWNGSVFCAVAFNSTVAATSPDGITWTTRTLPVTGGWQKVRSHLGELLVTATSGNKVLHSVNDGLSWAQRNASGVNRACVTTSAGFVMAQYGSTLSWFTTNNVSFTSGTLPANTTWYSAATDGSIIVAMNEDGSTVATGNADATAWTVQSAYAGNWRCMAYGAGRFVALESGDRAAVSTDSGVSWSDTVPADVYQVDCPSLLRIIDIYRAECPSALTVVNPAYRVECPSELRIVSGPYRAECPAALAIIDVAGGIQRPPRWTLRCLIDGVDESARVTGAVRVVAEEGAARIAELVIRPAAGVLLPLDYVGKPISLDYVPIYGGTGVPQRLFTGRIDTPSYDFAEGLLTLSCVDDLQNRVAALDRAAIDALAGGRYSTAVQGDVDDNWDYAQARMETVAGSLDAGPAGGIRVTLWELPSVWATFDESTLIYPMSRVSYPQRSTLINSVAVEFDYRYARLRQRNTALGWSGTNIDMRATGWRYPTQQEILGAANGSGWTVQNAVFYPAPAAIPHTSGGFIYPETGSIDMAILRIAQRHSQTVTEQYRFTVSAPESVEENGTLPGNVRGALESSFDGQAWESAFDVTPLLPGGGEMDYAPDATRTDAEYALQTLIDQAQVKILGSHRSTRVGNATVCMPDMDLDKRVAISTAALDAEGKVVSVTHTLDLRAGSAITEFELACFGAGGAGILTPDSLTPPTPPDPAVESQDWPSDLPSLFVATPYSNAYSDNLMGLLLNTPETILVEDVPSVGTQSFANPYYSPDVYPVEGFRVQMPGVDDADRNPLNKPAGQDYRIVLPADTLQITQP